MEKRFHLIVSLGKALPRSKDIYTVGPRFPRFWYSRCLLLAALLTVNNEGKLLFLRLIWAQNVGFCMRGLEFIRNAAHANGEGNMYRKSRLL